MKGSLQHGTQFSQKLRRKVFKVTGISSKMDGNEDFMISDTENESDSNDSHDDSSIGMTVNNTNMLVN